MTSPLEDVTSSMTDFSRSSNSPRNLAPATSRPMSSAITRLLCSESGTSSQMILLARPSAMAVLPTPALADEHRVVLGAPGQRLHHLADFPLAAHHRVQLADAGQFGQVNTVLFPGNGKRCSAFWSSTRCDPRSFCMA